MIHPCSGVPGHPLFECYKMLVVQNSFKNEGRYTIFNFCKMLKLERLEEPVKKKIKKATFLLDETARVG